jgi:hypothetical protein
MQLVHIHRLVKGYAAGIELKTMPCFTSVVVVLVSASCCARALGVVGLEAGNFDAFYVFWVLPKFCAFYVFRV